MKKILLICLFSLLSLSQSSAQSSLQLESTSLYQSSVIKPTWDNMIKLLFASMSTFKATMNKYNYSLTSEGAAYIANTSPGSPYFMIGKSTNDINMIFSQDDNGFISQMRQELRKKFKGISVSYESKFEIYRIIHEYEGNKYKIKIMCKEELSGGGMIGFVLQ